MLFGGEAASIFPAKMYVTCKHVPKLSHLAKRIINRDVRQFSFVKKGLAFLTLRYLTSQATSRQKVATFLWLAYIRSTTHVIPPLVEPVNFTRGNGLVGSRAENPSQFSNLDALDCSIGCSMASLLRIGPKRDRRADFGFPGTEIYRYTLPRSHCKPNQSQRT